MNFVLYCSFLVMCFSYNVLFINYEVFNSLNNVQFIYLNSLIPLFSFSYLDILRFFWILSFFCLVFSLLSASFSTYFVVLCTFIPTFILYVHFYISFK